MKARTAARRHVMWRLCWQAAYQRETLTAMALHENIMRHKQKRTPWYERWFTPLPR